MIDLNFIVFAIYFLIIIYNGLRVAKGVKGVNDFAIGNRSYSSFFIFATLSASFIGGGFTTGLAEKVYTHGLIYVLALFGFSLKELLIAIYLVPKMENTGKSREKNSIFPDWYYFRHIQVILISERDFAHLRQNFNPHIADVIH